MRKNNAKGLSLDCPYCACPDFISGVLAIKPGPQVDVSGGRIGTWFRRVPTLSNACEWQGVSGVERKRGRWREIEYTPEVLAERLNGFTVRLIGGDNLGGGRMVMPDPFFFSGWQRCPKQNAQHDLRAFFAFRMQHAASDVLVDVHTWPSNTPGAHDRIVTVRNMPPAGATARDLKIIAEAFKLLRKETRGKTAKLNIADVVRTIQELGQEATQRDAAQKLKVGVSTLQDWQRRQGSATWGELKKMYERTQIS